MATINTLEELEASPAISSTKEFLRNVKYEVFNPDTGLDEPYDINAYFVTVPSGEIVKALGLKDIDTMAMLLSKGVKITKKDGKRDFLPYSLAYKMNGAMKKALYEEFERIHGMNRKNSPPQTSDGVNSSSVESAETP